MLAENPPELADVTTAFTETYDLILEHHVQALEHAQAEGAVRGDIDPYTTARVFYSTLMGQSLWFTRWFGDDPDGKQFRAMLRVLLVDSLRPQ